MSKNARTVLTWTWCCKRAQWLKQHQPTDYTDLVAGGTDRFIPGYWVSLDYSCKFNVRRGKSATMPTIVEVEGKIDEHGKFWTSLRHKLTPTGYRKSFWDRYMPVSFPNGVPKRGEKADAVFHAPNGHKHHGWVKMTDHRNDPAAFSVQAHPGYLLINDESGKLVSVRNMKEGVNLSLGKPNESDDAVELVDFHGGRQETWRAFPATRGAEYQETVGDFSGAAETRAFWLKSIIDACNAGMMDLHRVLPLAARMWNAAYRFCQDHKDKGAYFIAYPMRKALNHQRNADPSPVLAWLETETVTVNGEEEKVPLNAQSVVRMTLPQIVIHWRGEASNGMYRYNHPIHACTLQGDRHITMTLPPHGNSLLYPKDHYAGLAGRTYMSVSKMRGERDWRVDGKFISGNPESTVLHLERAYHAIPIVVPSEDNSRRFLVSCGNGQWNQAQSGWKAGIEGGSYASWADHPDCVQVRSNWDDKCEGSMNLWETADSHGVGYAATPESAVAMVDEAMLIDSLPLS